ncbi:MAG: hypothetical protein RIR53_1948 [Bacteroidota bacterium]
MSNGTSNDRWIDVFLLRMQEPENDSERPYYTTGSIVSAALLRVAVLGLGCIALAQMADPTVVWWTAMLSIWGLGVYPAWLQYQRFHQNVQAITVGTLCGSCRYFNPTNQLCTIMDVHVTHAEPPCEGEGWEPKDTYTDPD